MKIRFWGTRGSIPSPGPSTIRYGGNTSCVEVTLDDGTLIVLDTGSGIRALGKSLGAAHGTLLLTHYHWDHIQGFPFFDSVYIPGSKWRVLGPEFNGAGMQMVKISQETCVLLLRELIIKSLAQCWYHLNFFGTGSYANNLLLRCQSSAVKWL